MDAHRHRQCLLIAPGNLPSLDRDYPGWALDAYQAVQAPVPSLVGLLDDDVRLRRVTGGAAADAESDQGLGGGSWEPEQQGCQDEPGAVADRQLWRGVQRRADRSD